MAGQAKKSGAAGSTAPELDGAIEVTGKRLEMRDIDSIIPYARNARVHDGEQIAKLRGSLRQFGFVKPLTIDEDGNLLAGHGILTAARAEGMTEVPCVVVTGLSEVDRQTYIIADNDLSDLSAWDPKMRELEVKRLGSLGANTRILGLKTGKLGTVDVEAYTRDAPGEGAGSGKDPNDACETGTRENESPESVTPDLPGAVKLMLGDCLEQMREIPDGSVDMVLCDLPYGTTECSWDTALPLDPLWEQWRRVCKSTAAVVLFGQMPFTAALVMSNPEEFRYAWIYEKTNATGFLNANKMPMKAHENISVFYRHLPVFNPQMGEGKPYTNVQRAGSDVYGDYHRVSTENDGSRYPRDVVTFNNSNGGGDKGAHPTQKPVALCEYLIRTYTNPGDTVLDNCMGSGTTGVACVKTGRKFIGIELDEGYFETAKRRIAGAQAGNPDDEGGDGDARREVTD